MEREKMEERSHIEADYTGHSEQQLDIAIEKTKNMTKQTQVVSSQAIFQNKIKTIYTDKQKIEKK